MAKAKISYLFNGTVHRESFEEYRISITTYSDGRAVVVIYNENDDRVRTLIFRAFERCEINFDPNQVDLAQVDTQAGSDPEVRKTLRLAESRNG